MGYTKVGIDIGEHEVKCVVIEEKNGMYSIKNKGIFNLPSDINTKLYGKKLKRGIKKFLRQSKIRTASLNFTIPVNSVDIIVKVLNIPFVEEKWLESTIKTELESVISDDLSSYVSRWDILEKDDSLNENTILTVLLKSEFTRLLNNMADITCKVDTIEIQPITVGRLIKDSSIFVDFGHKATRLYAFKEGKLVDVQVIKTSGNDIIEAIRGFRGLSTSVEDIIKILKEVEIQVEELDEVSNINTAVTKKLNNLIDEIKRRIRGIEINHNLVTENIYYAGELSNIKDFEEYLSIKLEYPSLKIEFLVDLEGGSEINKYLYAASCILAKEYGYLKGMNFAEKRVIPIDLNFLMLSMVALMLLTSIGFIDIHKRYDENILETQTIIDDLLQKRLIIDNQISEKLNAMYVSDELNNKIYMLQDRKTYISDMFYIIPERTPENVIITNISTTANITTINGIAETYTEIGVLSICLEDFGMVSIEDITIEGSELENIDDATDRRIEQGKKHFTLKVEHETNLLNN